MRHMAERCLNRIIRGNGGGCRFDHFEARKEAIAKTADLAESALLNQYWLTTNIASYTLLNVAILEPLANIAFLNKPSATFGHGTAALTTNKFFTEKRFS